MLHEISQSEKSTYYMIPHIRHTRKCKTMETVKIKVILRDLGGWMNSWSIGDFSMVKVLFMMLQFWIYGLRHLLHLLWGPKRNDTVVTMNANLLLMPLSSKETRIFGEMAIVGIGKNEEEWCKIILEHPLILEYKEVLKHT